MSLNNDCVKFQESLNAYIDNEVVDKTSVENHLSECKHCSDVMQKLTEAKNLLVNLPPSIPQKDFTSELEKKIAANTSNVIQGNFSRTALAAIFIALTGIIGFYALSNSHHNKAETTVAFKPENEPEQVQKIKKQDYKTEVQPEEKVAKEHVKQEPTTKTKEIKVQIASNKKEQPSPIQKSVVLQTAMKVQPKIDEPVSIALNTNDLSSANGLFDDLGFGSDEDGLYAIKL